MKSNKAKKVAHILSNAVKATTLVAAAGALIGCPTEVEEKAPQPPANILRGQVSTFNIWQTPNVSNEDAITATTAIRDTYNNWGPAGDATKVLLAGKALEIQIVPSTESDAPYRKGNTVIMRVKSDASQDDIKDIFTYIGANYDNIPVVGQAIIPTHDKGWQKMNGEAVKLANAKTKRLLGNSIA